MNKKKIICAGRVVVDILIKASSLSKDNICNAEEYHLAESMHYQLGGGATNTAVWLKSLRTNVLLIGCLGNDILQEFFLRNLAQKKIPHKLKFNRGHTSSSIIILRSQKQKHVYFHIEGANSEFSVEDMKSVAQKKDILYISGLPLLRRLGGSHFNSFLKSQKDKGVCIIIGTCHGGDLDTTANCLNYIDYLLINNKESRSLQKVLNISRDKNFSLLGPVIIRTDGKKGCTLFYDGSRYNYKAKHINLVDTIGAGDAFAAGFLCGLYRDLPIDNSIDLGILCSAKCCETPAGSNPPKALYTLLPRSRDDDRC